MPKPTLKERLAGWAESILPTRQRTRFNPRYQLPALAPWADVDTIQDFIRQAEAGDTRNLFALYRDVLLSDSHLQAEFGKPPEKKDGKLVFTFAPLEPVMVRLSGVP